MFSFIADANGIIMGEFGFITADDVYHVTVYATDENGNFKIISMKNIKLMKGPPPQSFASVTSTVTSTTSTTPQPFMVKTTAKSELTTPQSDEPACASCRLPAKPVPETAAPSSATDASTDAPPPFKVLSKDEQATTESPTTTSQIDILPQKIVNENENPGNLIEPRFGNDGIDEENVRNQQQYENKNENPVNNRILSQNPLNNEASPLNSRQPAYNGKLNSPQMFNKNAGNSEHYNKMENLMNGLLYRFDYSTDFQGHREEGDRLGNKEGEYYSVGRDNIKRVVSYKANEFGYMPFIRQEPLNPQELQNYDERNNRLRGYKFEWFYP